MAKTIGRPASEAAGQWREVSGEGLPARKIFAASDREAIAEYMSLMNLLDPATKLRVVVQE